MKNFRMAEGGRRKRSVSLPPCLDQSPEKRRDTLERDLIIIEEHEILFVNDDRDAEIIGILFQVRLAAHVSNG